MLPLVVEDLDFNDLIENPLLNAGYLPVKVIRGRL
jgi:hypothetical protein